MGRSWLWVGKPLRAPLRDGSSVLAAAFARTLPRDFDLAYLGDPKAPLGSGHTVVAAPPMGYAPTLRDKLRALGVLLSPRHVHRNVHFFFTPNPVTSRVVDGLRRLLPRRRFVQSVMSAHRVEAHARLLARLDRVIVLSHHSRDRLASTGAVPPDRIAVIHPAVPIPPEAPPLPDRPSILFAGDLDPIVADRLVALAEALPSEGLLTIAARPKAPADRSVRTELQRRLARGVRSGRVRLLGEVEDMEALFAEAQVVVHLADHVARKVDLPLVLIEAMARGRGVVTTRSGPLPELLAGTRAPAGRAVGGRDVVEAAAAAVRTGEAAAWGPAARRHAQERFDARRLGPALADVYDRLD